MSYRSQSVWSAWRGLAVSVCLTSASVAQEVVAELTLDAPEAPEFLLHGTVPVPRGTLLPGATNSPLTVLAPDGTPLVTQAEIVSRYPRNEDGADVVEVLARVPVPAGASPGERITYQIARQPTPTDALKLHGAVKNLLATEGAFLFQTRDVFGHRYEADLGAIFRKDDPRVRRDGALVRELVGHEVMLPLATVSGDEGTLPHAMGVHAWLRVFDQAGFVLLDVHAHNGLDGRDESDPADDCLDRLYIQGLSLRLPADWRVLHGFENPAGGSTKEVGNKTDHFLIDERPETVHLMPRQSRFVRRYAIALPGWEDVARAALEEHGLGFATDGMNSAGQPLWSWWNPHTARYFPQRHRLPGLDHLGVAQMRQQLKSELAEHEHQILTGSDGSYPFRSIPLGWAHPWGVAYGGMTGGDEIHPWDGLRTAAAASREGFRLAQLVTRAYSDRQPTALYNRAGKHTEVQDILVQGSNYLHAVSGFYLRPSSGFGFEDAPQFQTAAVFAKGLDDRVHEEIERFKPIDLQHYIRYTRNLKVLCWQGNDSLARHLLLSSAEVWHLSFHRYYADNYGTAPSVGLLTRMLQVQADPGEGISIGRGDAWGLDCTAAAYSVADESWREGKLDWLEDIARLMEEGQSTCSGNIQSEFFFKLFDGRMLARRANESGYLDHALVGLIESVFRDRFEERARVLDEVLVASVRAGMHAPYWSNEHKAQFMSVGTSPSDRSFPEFCLDVPSSGFDDYMTTEHAWSSLAYAYQRTADPFFLQRAAQLLGGPLFEDLHEDGEDWLESRAAILALVQSLQGG